MSVSRKKALEYADQLMAHPRSTLQLRLRRNKSGVTLLHNGRAVTRCYATKVGRMQAQGVAKALGVALPETGDSIDVTVPNGTFYRAIAISSLPLDIPEILPLLERYLEEASMARSLGPGIEA